MDAKTVLLSMLEYNYWANEHVLQRLDKLSSKQLHAATRISHGNAFDLVRHMVDTEWSWRLFASGGAGQKYLWEVEEIPDLPAIRVFWQAECVRMLDYVRSLPDADLARDVDYGTAQGGQPRYFKVWQILIHVVNHSTHHRSELSRYLDDCGITTDDLNFGNFVARSG